MITAYLFRSLDRKVSIAIVILFAVALLVPFANLIIPADSAFHLPTYLVSLFGKYLCYALLALRVRSCACGVFFCVSVFSKSKETPMMGRHAVGAISLFSPPKKRYIF